MTLSLILLAVLAALSAVSLGLSFVMLEEDRARLSAGLLMIGILFAILAVIAPLTVV